MPALHVVDVVHGESDDHACVDGLSCSSSSGGLACTNSNADDDGSTAASFHSRNYCPGPDLAHGWTGSHQEANFLNPALTRLDSPNDGFVLVNDGMTAPLPDERFQADTKGEGATEDDTAHRLLSLS